MPDGDLQFYCFSEKCKSSTSIGKWTSDPERICTFDTFFTLQERMTFSPQVKPRNAPSYATISELV